MAANNKQTILNRITGMVARLRFPWVFLITALIFLVDLLVPDVIPFIDEILLGLATVLLGFWKKRKSEMGLEASQSPSAPPKMDA